MDEIRAKKWSRLISIWYLLGSVLGGIFYLLVQLSIIEEEFSLYEHIDFYVEFVLGLIIFYGLLSIKPWSWKLTVIAIPLSWLFDIIYISLVYQQGTGFVFAMFIFIDVAILNLLFTPDVKRLFNIQNWSSFKWVITPLWLSGAFLAVYDIFGGALVAVIFSVSLFAGLKIVEKYRESKS
jgi:hypothetical protein